MPGLPRKPLPDALGAYRGREPRLYAAAAARPAEAGAGTPREEAVKTRREKIGR